MTTFRVTPRARDDLLNIARYTQQRWGRKQRNRYLKKIEQRFIWLADNPDAGQHRTDLCEGYRSFPEGQHIVFYLINADHIDIIGLPHKAMDVLTYFSE